MRDLPEEFDGDALVDCLADVWNLDVDGVEYAPVGGGSYHWVVTGRDRTRGFVTVDDLDRKPWLGHTRDLAFDGLRRAFDTSIVLRDGGLGFVLAPIPTGERESLYRIEPRYSIALFPFVDGTAGEFGVYDTAERAAVQAMLAELHRAPRPCVARRIDLDVPGRCHLESALREVDDEWHGGPLSEPARKALSRKASDVVDLLAQADRRAADLSKGSTDWVITHGEPHAANVMQTARSHVLVDWDTVAWAPPERDLWMLEMGADEPTIYVRATGHEVDRVARDFFRLVWDLADLAAFTNVLRSPHGESPDTLKAYDGLMYCLAIRERWATVFE